MNRQQKDDAERRLSMSKSKDPYRSNLCYYWVNGQRVLDIKPKLPKKTKGRK